jgi:hypothetical protein
MLIIRLSLSDPQRQMNIVQETYGEVFALELLVQQMFVSCDDPEYRALMALAVRCGVPQPCCTVCYSPTGRHVMGAGHRFKLRYAFK